MFSWQLSGEFIVFIIIGGVGRLFGPVIGALVFVGLEHFLGGISDFWHIYLGIILLLIVLFSKSGVIGLIAKKEMQMADVVLATQSITKSFGSLVACDDVSIELKADQIHAIIGPNGAGKSTLISQICGTQKPDSGRVKIAWTRHNI